MRASKLKRLILTVAGLALCGVLFLYFRREGPPETPAIAVRRASLVQTLTTNGKVEPIDSYEVHVRVASQVLKVNAKEGERVRQGQSLAEVDDSAPREALARAKAQLAEAQADQALLERGGKAVELADLDASIAHTRLEQEEAQREITSLQRLVEHQAVPRSDLDEQRQRLYRAQSQIAELERKRRAFLGAEDRAKVEARMAEAKIAVTQAEHNLQIAGIRAEASGVLYSLMLRPGAYYNAGDLVGRIGNTDKIRIRALVDEPELGRVETGQPVRVTWDALPGSVWNGQVQQLPSRVEAVGTRSVGEVICTIDNAEHRLIANGTVNVEIRTGEAQNALVVPREAVLREAGGTYVLTADSNGYVRRTAVKLGVHDPTRVQVAEGLREEQIVLLAGDRALSPGQRVQPLLQP